MWEEDMITEVEIYPIKPKDGLVGFASCIFDGKLSLNSIAIHTRADGTGYRLVYPAKVLPNGKVINAYFPINREVARVIEKAIIAELEKLAEKVGGKTENGKLR
jgi:DNA-binding cell septation regulator SpoVG